MTARTGGNPLYLRALARLLASRLPAGGDQAALARLVADSPELRGLVAAPLRGLDEHVRELVGGASVIGEEVDTAVLAAAAGRPVPRVLDELDAAVAAGVLVTVPREVGIRRFAHALVRDVVYAELDHSSRSYWHRRVAEALEPSASTAPDRAGVVATHRLAAAATDAELRTAAEWARRAADAANSRWRSMTPPGS